MQVKIDNEQVDVRDSLCKFRPCLRVGRFTHHSLTTGASGCSAWTDNKLSCLTRDGRGCPTWSQGERWASLEKLHTMKTTPVFSRPVIKVDSIFGNVKCRCGCNKSFPRLIVKEWQQRQGTKQ